MLEDAFFILFLSIMRGFDTVNILLFNVIAVYLSAFFLFL